MSVTSVKEKFLKSDIRKYGKWLFRRNTSCSTDDGDDDGEVASAIPGDGEGGDIDIDESLKKNVDQNHIIHENFLTPWGQKFGWRASKKNGRREWFKLLNVLDFFYRHNDFFQPENLKGSVVGKSRYN